MKGKKIDEFKRKGKVEMENPNDEEGSKMEEREGRGGEEMEVRRFMKRRDGMGKGSKEGAKGRKRLQMTKRMGIDGRRLKYETRC